MTLDTGHMALGLVLMALLFFPLAAAVVAALHGLERLGLLELAIPAWRLACPAALWAGWLAQALYWLGRERAQHEHRAQLDPHLDWWAGWNLLEWSLDARLDLTLPLLVNGLVVVAISAVLARNGHERHG